MVATAQDKVSTKLPRIVFHAPEEIKEKLERLATKRLRSISNLVRLIVEEEIANAEKNGELSELAADLKNQLQGGD